MHACLLERSDTTPHPDACRQRPMGAQGVARLKDIPEDLMPLVRAAQLSGGFCQERAIASAIGRERARCRQAVEDWRAGLLPGEAFAGMIDLLLVRIEGRG